MCGQMRQNLAWTPKVDSLSIFLTPKVDSLSIFGLGCRATQRIKFRAAQSATQYQHRSTVSYSNLFQCRDTEGCANSAK